MKRSITAKQKKRGRPATGITPMIGVRLHPEVRLAVEAWAGRHGKVSLSEAIRLLIGIALKR